MFEGLVILVRFHALFNWLSFKRAENSVEHLTYIV